MGWRLVRVALGLMPPPGTRSADRWGGSRYVWVIAEPTDPMPEWADVPSRFLHPTPGDVPVVTPESSQYGWSGSLPQPYTGHYLFNEARAAVGGPSPYGGSLVWPEREDHLGAYVLARLEGRDAVAAAKASRRAEVNRYKHERGLVGGDRGT
jgi:hypothetical protein